MAGNSSFARVWGIFGFISSAKRISERGPLVSPHRSRCRDRASERLHNSLVARTTAPSWQIPTTRNIRNGKDLMLSRKSLQVCLVTATIIGCALVAFLAQRLAWRAIGMNEVIYWAAKDLQERKEIDQQLKGQCANGALKTLSNGQIAKCVESVWGIPHPLGLKGSDGVIRQVPGHCGPNAHTELVDGIGRLCIQNEGQWMKGNDASKQTPCIDVQNDNDTVTSCSVGSWNTTAARE